MLCVVVVLLLAAVIALFVSGVLQRYWHSALRFFHHEHQKYRRHQRPSRVFLIRHGQSQANVDTSKLFVSLIDPSHLSTFDK